MKANSTLEAKSCGRDRDRAEIIRDDNNKGIQYNKDICKGHAQSDLREGVPRQLKLRRAYALEK